MLQSPTGSGPFSPLPRWRRRAVDTDIGHLLNRSVATRVIIIDGHLPASIAAALEPENRSRRAAFIETIDGAPPAQHPFGGRLVHDFGWTSTSIGEDPRSLLAHLPTPRKMASQPFQHQDRHRHQRLDRKRLFG